VGRKQTGKRLAVGTAARQAVSSALRSGPLRRKVPVGRLLRRGSRSHGQPVGEPRCCVGSWRVERNDSEPRRGTRMADMDFHCVAMRNRLDREGFAHSRGKESALWSRSRQRQSAKEGQTCLTPRRHNGRPNRPRFRCLRRNLGLHDTPRHSQRGLVNRGSAVRVRSPALAHAGADIREAHPDEFLHERLR